jgi:hypothetical protein
VAQLISGLDAAYKRSRNSWQDTSPPPNLLVRHLGPGLTNLALQLNLNLQTANQAYHRESMKGQTADVPNLRPLSQLALPPLLANSFDEAGGEVVHRDSMKGQTFDTINLILPTGILNPFAQPRMAVINPVFNKHPTQETTVQRNPILDLITITTPTIPTQFEVEEVYRRDSLSGQYSRMGAIIPFGVPPAFNEIYTFVPRLKTAQEPFVFPNVVIRGVPANISPTVVNQADDNQYRAKPAQDPFVYPNLLATEKPVANPFVHVQYEDLQWKAKPAQEPWIFPNVIIVNQLPNFPAAQLYEHLQWKAKPAQEPFVFPNIIIENLPPNFVFPFVQQLFDHLHLRGRKPQEHYEWHNNLIYILPPIIPVPPTGGTGIGRYGGRVILQSKKLGETVFQNIDFISQLGVNETILTATCTCNVYTGTDPSPSSMIDGVALVTGTVVSQLVTGGVVGTIYELLASVTTSLGQTLELSGYLAVVPDLP